MSLLISRTTESNFGLHFVVSWPSKYKLPLAIYIFLIGIDINILFGRPFYLFIVRGHKYNEAAEVEFLLQQLFDLYDDMLQFKVMALNWLWFKIMPC